MADSPDHPLTGPPPPSPTPALPPAGSSPPPHAPKAVASPRAALAARRSASVVVVTAAGAPGEAAVILSASTRSDTQLVYIDAATGAVLFDPAPGVGTFPHEAAALAELEAVWPAPPLPPPTAAPADGASPPPPRSAAVVVATGTALLGYSRYAGGAGRALLLVKAASRVAALPGGHAVRRVDAAEWVRLPPRAAAAPPLPDDGWPPAARFRLDDLHYYCDTADVTRPFPGRRGAEGGDQRGGGDGGGGDPSWEFVWNRALAAPFRDAGVPAACPHLLQGVAATAALGPPPPSASSLSLTLLTRASRLHAGTRYLARGLNEAASPGNEVEAEQVVWGEGAGGGIDFAACVWRRGTVPVWWSVALRGGGVGEAAIEVTARAPYRGTRRYFRRLQRRYCWSGDGGGGGGGGDTADGPTPTPTPADPSNAVPIHCINLLRCAMSRRDELLLSEHFAEGVRRARSGGGGGGGGDPARPPLPLRLVNFDWHAVTKELGEAGAVEGLWSALRPLLGEVGVTVGTLTPSPASPPPSSRDGAWPGHTVAYTSRQRGVLRFNCADSLDRTNAASYFAAVAAAAEQARALGRAAALARPPPPPSALADTSLPPGWEAAATPDGRTFYIDHANRATTWTRPPSPAAAAARAALDAASQAAAPWGVASMLVPAVAAALAPAAVAAHAAAHRAAGDAHARLYTASPAMHSGVLGLLTGDRDRDGDSAAARAARRGADRVRNAGVSVVRRWANVTGDAARHAAAAAFLAGGEAPAALGAAAARGADSSSDGSSGDRGDRGGGGGGGGVRATAAALAAAAEGVAWSASESDGGPLTAAASALSLATSEERE